MKSAFLKKLIFKLFFRIAVNKLMALIGAQDLVFSLRSGECSQVLHTSDRNFSYAGFSAAKIYLVV